MKCKKPGCGKWVEGYVYSGYCSRQHKDEHHEEMNPRRSYESPSFMSSDSSIFDSPSSSHDSGSDFSGGGGSFDGGGSSGDW